MGFIYHSITLHYEVYSYNKLHPVETPTPPRPSQPKIFRQAALKRSHPTTCQEVVATQILRCFLLSWRSLLQETCGSTLPLHLHPQIASKYCWFWCWRSFTIEKVQTSHVSSLHLPKPLKLTAGFIPENRWMLGKCSFPFGGFGGSAYFPPLEK